METNKCELKGCSNPAKNIFENKQTCEKCLDKYFIDNYLLIKGCKSCKKTKRLYTINKSFPVCKDCINKVKNKTNKCFTKGCKYTPKVNFKELDMCELCLSVYLWRNYCVIDIKCESIDCETKTNIYINEWSDVICKKHIDNILAGILI